MINSKGKLVITFKEGQELLGVGKNTMLDLCHREDFPSFKLGGKWLINYEKLKQWVDDMTGDN